MAILARLLQYMLLVVDLRSDHVVVVVVNQDTESGPPHACQVAQ